MNDVRRRARPLVSLLAAGLAWLAAAPPSAAQEPQGESSRVEADEQIGDEQVVLGDGHIDIGPRFLDGEWTLLLRDDTVDPSVWRRLPDVVLQATDAATVQVPDDPAFAFLGQPGTQVWLLPQVQQPGILWPGWNTQDPEVATTVDREVTWTLNGVDGPGEFVLFVNQDFGEPLTIFDSHEPPPQTTSIETNTHAHGNWAFTASGLYRLDVQMAATTSDGQEVTASGTLQLAVGDAVNPQDAFVLEAPPAEDIEDGDEAGSAEAGSGAGEEGSTEAGSHDGRDDRRGSAAPWTALGAGAVLLAMLGTVLLVRARARRSIDPPDDATTTPATSEGL